MSGSTNSDLHSQAALYLFGQLPRAEAKAFESEADQAHREALAEMTELAACLALADGPVAPPPELKIRVLERIERNPYRGR